MTTPTNNPSAPNDLATTSPTQGEVNLDNANIELIHGNQVHVTESAVNQIDADQVDMLDSHANMVDTHSFSARDSFINQAHSETMTLSDSNVGVAYTQEATLGGNIGALFTQAATLNESRAGLLVAREIHGDRIQSGFFLAGRVDAPVETVIDVRSALIIGATTGVVMGAVLGFIGLLVRRKK
jgi:hypothetical protein